MPTFETNKRSIGELLSMTNPPIIVPEWQRNYSWTTREVETFWLDLVAFSKRFQGDNIKGREYFLGSVVLVLRPDAHLLLDGQQRAATATILLSVIRQYLALFKKDAATRINQRYITDYDDASDRNTYKLTLNQYDRDYFRNHIQDNTGHGATATSQLKSHELIQKAQLFFVDKFRAEYDQLGGGDTAFRWALRIQRVLTKHMSVVTVTSDDEDSAASIFETLNDRGIGLSTPDLLRNLLIRRAKEDDREEVVECWLDVLEVDEDGRVQDFLRHYWLSRRGDVKTRRLYREIKDYVEENDVDSLDLSRKLREAAKQYRTLVSAHHDDPETAELLEDLRELGAKALLPAVMSAVDVGTEQEARRLLDALVRFFVRHNLIGNLENSRLETVAYRLAQQLRTQKDFKQAHQALEDAVPALDHFEVQFKSASIARQKSARYLLRKLEQQLRNTKEVDVAAPHRVHLEHIYPKKPLQGEQWSHHSQVLNRIGNLTLLSRSLNQAIRNGRFEAKRDAYRESELLQTRALAEYDEWSPEAISVRQAEQAHHARTIWKLFGED